MKEIKLSKEGVEQLGNDAARGKFFLVKWHRDDPNLIVVKRINQFGKELKSTQVYHKDFFIISSYA